VQSRNDIRLGARVRVASTHHWAQGALATIAQAPDSVSALASVTWPRVVESRNGRILFYWVVFDEPQFDAEGDGPYEGAEIDARYLEPVDV
jgi:hypothetical protein